MSSKPAAPKSLREQLLLWLLAPLVVIVVINAALSYQVAITTANEAYDRLLLASVRSIADRVTAVDGKISVDIPYVALELFESKIQERIFYKVTGPDGMTITGYDDLPAPPRDAPRDKPIFFPSQYQGERLHQAAVYKSLYDPSINGPILVQVGETAESRDALSQRMLYDGLLRQVVLILVAALLLWLGVRAVLRPLTRLRDSIARRSASDITPVEDAGVQSEVRPLIQAINQHTDRIDKLIASRVRFVADAAHQVRTRLTILKTQVEYGLRLQDAESLHAVLSEAQVLVDQTARFFNQLLVLANAEANAVPGRDIAPLDLAALAHGITLEWVPEARAKEIVLGFEGPAAGVDVRGHAVLLRELVTNLLDNAIRYTQFGGSVTVRIAAQGDDVLLEVEDNGPGIAEEERERVFERFYRGPDSQPEGSGLGLPIVREIARSHGATIELTTAPGGDGLLVRVTLHATQAPPTSPRRSTAASAA
jgi:two-component system sensor histidine kinase TctE